MADNTRIDELRKRLEKEPGSRLFAQLAEELRKDGQFEEAVRVARAGLQTHPTYASARMTLGRALMDSGDLAGGRVEFEAVLQSAHDNILASRFLAECLEGLGDLAGALQQFQATLGLAPGDRQIEEKIHRIQERLAAPPAVSPPPGTMAPAPVAAAAATPGQPATRRFVAPPPPRAPAPPQAAAPEPRAVVVEPDFELEGPFDDEDTLRPAPADPVPADTLSRTEAPTVPPTARTLPPGAGIDPPLASSTLAELYLSQGFVEKAAQVYRQIVQRTPEDERLRSRLAEVEVMDRQLKEAEEAAADPEGQARLRKRRAIERTIARLEDLLAAVKRP